MKIETYLKVITLLLFTVSPLFAQESIQLSGTVSAPFLEEASIHIINSTQKTGTVNSPSGSFKIMVSENDELLFSSVQYKNVNVIITSEIIKKGILDIELVEDLNVLAEVNISDISLTGSLTTDISNMEMVETPKIDFNFGDIKNLKFESDINDPAAAPRNLAFESNQILKPGANILGLADGLADLFGIKKERKRVVYNKITKTSREQLETLFNNDFYSETLKIEQDYIQDFVYYADDHGLSDLLRKPNNQLAIMDFLIEQSKGYLANRNN